MAWTEVAVSEEFRQSGYLPTRVVLRHDPKNKASPYVCHYKVLNEDGRTSYGNGVYGSYNDAHSAYAERVRRLGRLSQK